MSKRSKANEVLDPIVLVHGWGELAQRARTVKSVRWGGGVFL